MSSPSLNILLVEDHEDTAKMMRLVLERQGFAVRMANGAAQARQITESETFDVCLCDLRLPDGDGETLCRELNSRYGLKCICLSGDIARSDLSPEPGSPFVACLAKPLDMPAVLEAIQMAKKSSP